MIRFNKLDGKWEVKYHGQFFAYSTKESAECKLALLKGAR